MHNLGEFVGYLQGLHMNHTASAFLKFDQHVSIQNALMAVHVHERGYVRQIVNLQDEDAVRNGWFDLLDAFENDLHRARTAMIDDQIKHIEDTAKWQAAYDACWPLFNAEAQRLWSKTLRVIAPQIAAWLEQKS
jgi:hypothetical protein